VRSTDGYTASYAITPSTVVEQPKGKHAAGQPQPEAPAGQPAPAEQPGPAGQSAPAASSTAGLRPNESVMVLATKGATGDTATASCRSRTRCIAKGPRRPAGRVPTGGGNWVGNARHDGRRVRHMTALVVIARAIGLWALSAPPLPARGAN
jgi:hypothetical protein